MKKNRAMQYLPIFLVILYSVTTILLFIISPWEWNVKNSINLYGYLLLLNIALFLGYFWGTKKHKTLRYDYKKHTNKILKMLSFVLYIYLLVSILEFILTYDLSIKNFFSVLFDAIINPAKFYYSFSQSSSIYSKILIWINVILAPIFYCVIPLCTYYFKQLNMIAKSAYILLVCFELFTWILKGTNKGIFDLFFIIFSVIFIKGISEFKDNKLKIFFKKNKMSILLSIIVGITIIIYFVNNISSRVSDVSISLGNIMGGINVDNNSILKSILPKGLFNMLLIISSYLCQGYYALSLGLSIPFTSTYGVGFSNFLLANMKEMLNIDLYSRTYLVKLEELGWSSTVNWHTMYMWFANDVSFVGVILIMVVIGYLFASIWHSFIETHNPIALCILTLFSTMFIYISCNNQIFNFPTTFTAFWGLLIIWFIMKRVEVKDEKKCRK